MSQEESNNMNLTGAPFSMPTSEDLMAESMNLDVQSFASQEPEAAALETNLEGLLPSVVTQATSQDLLASDSAVDQDQDEVDDDDEEEFVFESDVAANNNKKRAHSQVDSGDEGEDTEEEEDEYMFSAGDIAAPSSTVNANLHKEALATKARNFEASKSNNAPIQSVEAYGEPSRKKSRNDSSDMSEYEFYIVISSISSFSALLQHLSTIPIVSCIIHNTTDFAGLVIKEMNEDQTALADARYQCAVHWPLMNSQPTNSQLSFGMSISNIQSCVGAMPKDSNMVIYKRRQSNEVVYKSADLQKGIVVHFPDVSKGEDVPMMSFAVKHSYTVLLPPDVLSNFTRLANQIKTKNIRFQLFSSGSCTYFVISCNSDGGSVTVTYPSNMKQNTVTQETSNNSTDSDKRLTSGTRVIITDDQQARSEIDLNEATLLYNGLFQLKLLQSITKSMNKLCQVNFGCPEGDSSETPLVLHYDIDEHASYVRYVVATCEDD